MSKGSKTITFLESPTRLAYSLCNFGCSTMKVIKVICENDAYSRIYSHFQQHFSNIWTAHAQKRLFMNFRCKFRHSRSIRRPRFPIRVQNLSDLATFSVDYCILYAECPPYFYFWFVWPTDLESIPHASTPKLIIPTKFQVGMTIHCRVIAFLSADTARDLVTLTFDRLTLNSCSAWRVTWPTLPPS